MLEANALQPELLLARFCALDEFLLAHQDLWRPKPFTCLQLGWELEHPELADWLRSRSLEQAEAAHNQPHLLDAPQPFPDLARQSVTLSQTTPLPQRTAAKVSSRLATSVPGRKWQQIEAFSSCLSFRQKPVHWLDWCAGKGHLGRYLTQTSEALTCIERDAHLVADGRRLSEKLQIKASHLQLDVLEDRVLEHLVESQSPVALHACGDLHVRLMQLASAAGCKQLAIAPCCYNRTQSEHYQPLSSAAQSSALRLERDDLRLLQCEAVTAGRRVRQQRDISMARRLSFDLLQREIRGVDDYLPTPPLAAIWLQRPFAEYCAELARLKQLNIGQNHDWSKLESAGWQRLANVRNLELLRDLFRRPLEVWLILDRALYLQAQGYRVRLGSFSETSLTPRNLLLLAERD